MDTPNYTPKTRLERGQALVEYALITVLIGLTFGLGLAASGPVVGDLFDRIIDDVLRQTAVVDAPGGNEFWATVTEVFVFVPTGGALATNTPVPPTAVSTLGGPTPTYTHTYTPSPTQPSATPTMTKTPADQQKSAPFKDTVDEPTWWRIDNNINLRGLPWTGSYFDNTTLAGAVQRSVPGIWQLDANGVFITGFPAATPGQNFSVRYERTIEVLDDPGTPQTETQPLTFRILADDGVRMFMNGNPVTLVDVNGNTNSWVTQSAPVMWTGTAVASAGLHTLTIEYFNTTGVARLKVDITGAGANPDDAPATVGNPFACNWGIAENRNDSNTESNLFDDYVGAPSGANATCYLEWRGSVIMPDSMTRPELVFWDVWDLPSGSEAWVEIGEYIPVDPMTFPLTLNRSAMSWQRVNLSHSTGGTANYNWTRNTIDLTPYLLTFTNTPKYLAFRFVMKTGAVNSQTKWHIEDIEFRDATTQVFTANRTWTLDDANERFDFIVNGGRSNPGSESGWRLVTNNRYGTGGLAWHDSANPAVDDPNDVAGNGPNGVNGYTPYKRHSESPNSEALNNVRVHALEFNGFIDLANVPNPDSLGNTGNPILSFYQGYHLGSRTGLEIQYTTDGYDVSPANWQTVPGGVIRSITQTGEARVLTLQDYSVSLNGLPGNPSQIRLRFAMLVHVQAETKDGWWIDEIRLGRAESPKWLNYPFFDSAQGTGAQLFWTYSGAWEPSNAQGYISPTTDPNNPVRSYASSARANYTDGQTTYLTMRWPIDLYNDTPAKRVIEDDTGLIISTNGNTAPATDPELTFYHRRDIASTDDFRIEWKRVDEADTAWRPLWMYRYTMATASGSPSARTARNNAWEFTRVSLYPILKQIATDGGGAPGVGTGAALRDDDIMLRFALNADGSSNAGGVYVDDIRVDERSTQVVKLWSNSQNRTDPFNGQSLGVGTGAAFSAEPDFVSTNQEWWEVFRVGSGWTAVNYQANGGALSFHDSAQNGQDKAPSGYRNVNTEIDDFGDPAWYTPHNTYNVIEFEPIIDLRGVQGEAEAPMMSFWTRYHIGTADFIRVEISTEDTRAAATIDGSMSGRCQSQPVLQCYHQERGWNAWTTVWTQGSSTAARTSYGWHRVMINLSPYAYLANSNTQGKRIRVRFVYDALDTNDNFDGWYIDNIIFERRLPYTLTTNINTSDFDDRSRNLTNWTAEGDWGLDVAIYQGGGGGPVSLGVWDVKWWDCATCESLAPSGTSSGNRFLVGTNIFLQNPSPVNGHQQQLMTNINYRFYTGSPVSGWNKVDRLVMRAVIDTPVIGGLDFPAGVRSFSTRADDGVRIKVEELVGGVPVTPTPTEWNVLNRWTDSSERADQGTFTFFAGKRYRITLDYYEKSGDGVITLTVTDGRFSFSDSPKAASGPIPDVRPLPYSNTSLILRNVLDLTEVPSTSIVLLEYQTKYRISNDNRARLEVSSDGGFTWVTSNLTQAVPPAFSSYNFSFSGTSFDGSTGVTNPATDAWQVRLNNLTAYRGRYLLIRFRFDRQTSGCVRRSNTDCYALETATNPTLHLADAYYDGWWITPVRVMKFDS